MQNVFFIFSLNKGSSFLIKNITQSYYFNYNYMNRAVLPFLSLITISSFGYLLHKELKRGSEIIERAELLEIIITLRKSIFSTLREIAYAANCLKIEESGIEARKIKDIMMRDGSSAEAKLQNIQKLVLQRYQITRQIFQRSCKHYSENDLEIKLLLQHFKNDIQIAMDGSVESYHGVIPKITASQTITLYREIIWRRMKIIQEKLQKGVDNLECLKMSMQIEQYLQKEGIFHKTEPAQKVFIALLQYHYKHSSEFMSEFESLEQELEEFIEEVRQKKQLQKQDKS